MRKRYQKGSLRKMGGSWVAQWWEDGHRRSKVLGQFSSMGESEARRRLAEIIEPVNKAKELDFRANGFGDFVEQVFFPWARRKWKSSTAATTGDRIRLHLCQEFRNLSLRRFTRQQLQEFLDRRAASGLGHSTVSHLRWDLKQIFRLAVADDYIERNPTDMLFTPRGAHRSLTKRMTWKEVTLALSVLHERERLIVSLAVIGGMRPGEIFALQCKHLGQNYISVCQRIYRGEIDTPKTFRSVRKVALSEGLIRQVMDWKSKLPDSSPDAWLFPSERGTPLARDNCLRRSITPRLKAARLGWVNFQVMRRTHCSLMRELEIDPKVVADQLGHTLDVNLNVYTKSDLACRRDEVNQLEIKLQSLMEQTH